MEEEDFELMAMEVWREESSLPEESPSLSPLVRARLEGEGDKISSSNAEKSVSVELKRVMRVEITMLVGLAGGGTGGR